MQTKLQVLKSTQSKEVAEQKLHTFRDEFGQTREGFAGTVEQQIQLLTERLDEQPRSDEILLSLIAALAEQPLSAFESDDMGRHWKTRRYGGWGHLYGLQASVAGLVFPKVQQLLDTRTALFMQYAKRFEDALLHLSHSSDEIAARLELGTNVPLDVSGKLKVVLNRSMQNAQEMIVVEERKVLQLLDDFVTDSVADRISEKRRVVADIWDTGTTIRQNAEVKAFYREVKALLKDALQSYLKESSRRFGEFLLAEAKAAPRDALDEVQVLLEQAADNILAAAALHLEGQTEEAVDLITTLDSELAPTLERVRSVMPNSAPMTVVNDSAAPTQPSAKAPVTLPVSAMPVATSTTDDNTDWADAVQAAATVCVDRLQLREGSTGWSYEKLFAPRLLQGALQLSLIDPYLSGVHQLRNLQEFLMHVAEAAKPKAIEIITSHLDQEAVAQQNRVLNVVTKDLFQQFGVVLTLRREAGLHDRYLRLNHGVLFKLGRGLDVYKPAIGLALHRPAIRRVRATEIDVFVQPGHVLASQQGSA
ncbi:MAG: MIT C-terminal domain-containing protein [Candidatus Nanopelagicales bacterium]